MCKRHDQHACSIRPEDETPTIRQHDTRCYFNVSSKADIPVGLIYRTGPQTKKVEKKRKTIKQKRTCSELSVTAQGVRGVKYSVSFRLKLCEGGFSLKFSKCRQFIKNYFQRKKSPKYAFCREFKSECQQWDLYCHDITGRWKL